MFVQLSGARSFTQQQWTVSCRGTAPHKKPFVRWMFGIKDGKSQNGVWVFFFFTPRTFKVPQNHAEIYNYHPRSMRNTWSLLPFTKKAQITTCYCVPESQEHPSISRPPAIKSAQVCRATQIKARIQTAPIPFPFLLSNYQFCKLLQNHLPCCPIWVFFILEILQIKVVCSYKAEIQS